MFVNGQGTQETVFCLVPGLAMLQRRRSIVLGLPEIVFLVLTL